MWNSQQPSSRDEGNNHQEKNNNNKKDHQQQHIPQHAATAGDPRLASLATAYQPNFMAAYGTASNPHAAAYAVGSSSSAAHPFAAVAAALPLNTTIGGSGPNASASHFSSYPFVTWEQQQLAHASSYHNGTNGNNANRDSPLTSATATTSQAPLPLAKPPKQQPPTPLADDDDKPAAVQPPVPRGKPEVMAQKLAAARIIQANLEELESQRHEEKGSVDDNSGSDEDKIDDDDNDEDDDNDDDEDDDEVVVAEPVTEEGGILVASTVPAKSSSSSSPPRAGGKSPKSNKGASSRSSKKASSSPSKVRRDMLSSASASPITEIEYENLETLMIQFCRVPLLAEFSRPVTLLHPEVRVACRLACMYAGKMHFVDCSLKTHAPFS